MNAEQVYVDFLYGQIYYTNMLCFETTDSKQKATLNTVLDHLVTKYKQYYIDKSVNFLKRLKMVRDTNSASVLSMIPYGVDHEKKYKQSEQDHKTFVNDIEQMNLSSILTFPIREISDRVTKRYPDEVRTPSLLMNEFTRLIQPKEKNA